MSVKINLKSRAQNSRHSSFGGNKKTTHSQLSNYPGTNDSYNQRYNQPYNQQVNQQNSEFQNWNENQGYFKNFELRKNSLANHNYRQGAYNQSNQAYSDLNYSNKGFSFKRGLVDGQQTLDYQSRSSQSNNQNNQTFREIVVWNGVQGGQKTQEYDDSFSDYPELGSQKLDLQKLDLQKFHNSQDYGSNFTDRSYYKDEYLKQEGYNLNQNNQDFEVSNNNFNSSNLNSNKNFKKTFLGVNYLVIGMLAFAILFTSITGVAVYGQNKILEENEYYKKCQEFLKKEKEKINKSIIETDTKPNLECQRKELSLLNFYESGKSRQSYNENLEKAVLFENQVKETIEKLKQEITSLEQELKQEPKDLNGLEYQKLKEYKTELDQKKAELDQKNQNLAKDIKDDLKILKDEDKQKLEQSIKDVQDKSITEQEENLKKIQEEAKRLRDEEEKLNKERVLKEEMAMYKELSGEGFKSVYQQVEKSYSKTLPEIDTDIITGDPEVDARIVQIATARGYEKRRQAVESELVPSENGERLQPELAQAFSDLREEAQKDGINLVMVSGYRSVDNQRQIFLSRLGALSIDEIKAGVHDETINELLKTTSIPGYSRHHTGYTFDIGCNNGQLTVFRNTPCYAWISKNNYLVAKKFGIIPSYPEGASLQGPNPEAWEYVWVGESILKK